MKKKKPRIGITRDINVMRCRILIKLIRVCGGIPVLMPVAIKKKGVGTIDDHLKLIDRLLENCDALIFPGNRKDVDPKLYGQKNIHPETLRRLNKNPLNVRQDVELRMLEYVLKHKNMPVLGICGGMQLINVALGGDLVQHLPEDPRTDNGQRKNYHFDDSLKTLTKIDRLNFENNFESILRGRKKNIYKGTHEMKVYKGSMLAKIYQENDSNINLSNIKELSIHHQGCFKENISDQLKITAISPDGVVEAAEHKTYPKMFLLTQFHPECNASGIAANLVKNLIQSI